MYRKFTAGHIFNGHKILPEGHVLVTNSAGKVEEIVPLADAGDDIEYFNGLLSPGFINSHCHLELSHLKGIIPEHTGLVDFVQYVMKNRGPGGEEREAAMVAAEQELYRGGTVAVGDICNTANTLGVKEKSRIIWHNFIELSGFVDATAEKRFQESLKIHDDFIEAEKKLPGKGFSNRTTLVPHAPYSVSRKLFGLLNANTSGQVITIHNQECAAENELYQNKTGDFLKLYQNIGVDIAFFQPTGKTSLQSWLPCFTNGQPLILVHNTFTGAEDISFCQGYRPGDASSIFFCLCPNANRYIEDKMPPMDLLRESGFPIIIGTDSYASNYQLDVFEEVKTIMLDTDFDIPLQEVLKWATLNGAMALRMDDELGSFEKGKTPGVVQIEKLEELKVSALSNAKRIF